ncbi:helicase-associated domain-containing protein [Kitasatospora sp. NPDC006697]|uniref:helicase-associated domain-containing protein n=1 Tax=Kitasatospora sp. NPDC006697 TaxID=3364020 RepID=UPI0036BF8262
MASGSALAGWLHRLDAAQLSRVLARRPDAVAAPVPRTVGELADRLQRTASVALALGRLTLPELQVLEALTALTPAPGDLLAQLLDASEGDRARRLDEVLAALGDHALVWPGGDGLLRTAPALRRFWELPLGLDAPLEPLLAGATSEDLGRMVAALGIRSAGARKQQRLDALLDHHRDPDRLLALVARAPKATRELLARWASGEPGSGSEPAARWAVERALLVRHRHQWYDSARMPAEVSLALRDAGWRAPFAPVPPAVEPSPVSAAELEREAAAAGMAFVSAASAALRACATTPPARLKSGGIGARELARIGKTAQCGGTEVRIALELAHAAGVLAFDGDRLAVTGAYDRWAEQEPAERLSLLLRTWWALPLTPGESRDEDGKPLAALAGAGSLRHAARPEERRQLLATAAELPAGEGARNPADLAERLAWRRPLLDRLPQDERPFATLVREVELLGVLARGALTPLGRALLADDSDALTAACQRLLPAATATARFGSDLTAVVSGTPSTFLATLLDSVADRETTGAASVWRFSPRSVRRALDSGRSSDDLTTDLAAVAVGPLPQTLSYLIQDASRGHGRIRVAAAASVIHGEEPALLAELAAHRKLAPLGLRLLAPTVLICRTPLDKTLTALRAAGYAPVAEKADGSIRIERAEPHRAAGPVLPPPRRSATESPAVKAAEPLDAVDLGVLAGRLLGVVAHLPDPDPDRGRPFHSDTEEIIAGSAHGLSFTDVRQLAHALDEGLPITIEYVAASGDLTIRTLSRLELDAPFLQAWCHLREDGRMFTLSRIQAVMPA